MATPFNGMSIKDYYEQVQTGTVSLPDESGYSDEIKSALAVAAKTDSDAAALHVMSELGAYSPSTLFEEKKNKKEFDKLKNL